MPLQVPALVNGTTMVHQLLTEPCPECFDQSTAAVGDEQDPLGERQPAHRQGSVAAITRDA